MADGGDASTRMKKELKDNDKEKARAKVEDKVQSRLVFERKAHSIVETLLDNPVTEDFLLDCAISITPQHYRDVVTERSILKQCGYPLCQRSLGNVPKQQYHISPKTNQVYDITERKCFCSQFCYKASRFYEAQVSDSPLWTRDMDEPLDIKVLTPDMEVDSTTVSLIAKDNVLLTDRIDLKDVDDAGSGEKDTPPREERAGLLEDDLSSLTFAETRQRERLQELAAIGAEGGSAADAVGERKECEEGRLGSALASRGEDEGSGHSAETRKKSEGGGTETAPDGETKTGQAAAPASSSRGLPGHASEEKQVPVDVDDPPAHSSSLPADAKHGGARPKTKRKPKKSRLQKPTEAPLLDMVQRNIKEWMTDATVAFLSGRQEPPLIQQPADRTRLDSGAATSTLTPDPQAVTSKPPRPPVKPLPGMERTTAEVEEFSLRVQEFYYGRQLEGKKKKDTKSSDTKEEDSIGRTLRLPLVDSKSQMAIRRKIVSERLNRALSEILLPLGLSMRDVTGDLQGLIGTFHLQSTNITFKPAGWTMLALLLLQILAKRNAAIRDSVGKDDSRRFLDSLLVRMGSHTAQVAEAVGQLAPHAAGF